MKTPSAASLVLSLTLAVSFLSGCSTLRTVNVQQDASLSGASVQVDLVAVTDKNKNIETCSVRDYWHGAGLRQSSNTTTLRFGSGQSSTQTVTKNWKSLGAKSVVVLADLPGVFQDAPGNADPRRKIIPVQKSQAVTVRVSPSGLSVESAK